MSYRNQATWDRLLHILLGFLMLALGLWVLPDGLWAAALRVFGVIPLVIGALGWSPVYTLLGWSSRRPAGPGSHQP